MEIQVSNIQPATSQSDLIELFEGFTIGRCSKVRTIGDVSKDVMKSFVYISIEDNSAGEAAIAKLNNTLFKGIVICVKKGN
jgi:RNA recognition motif-containing protein